MRGGAQDAEQRGRARALRLTAHRLRDIAETSGDVPADAARAVGHMLAMQGCWDGLSGLIRVVPMVRI